MSYLDDLRQDLRYSLRGIKHAPATAAMVIATLAIGVGANVTMAGAIELLLLRPPAGVRDPDRLVRLLITGHDTFGDEIAGSSTNYLMYLDVEREVPAFESVAAYSESRLSFGVGADAEQVRATLVSPTFFSVFGPTPALGRFFAPADGFPPGEAGGGPPVAVLDHAFWRRKFGGEVDVIGRTVRIGTLSYSVVGVAPEGFQGSATEATDVWLPAGVVAPVERPMLWYAGRGATWIKIIGRLKSGATRAMAEQQATATFRRNEGGPGGFDERMHVTAASVIRGRGPDAPREVKLTLWLGGVSAFVLLIACANITNLLLARALTRGREIAVRLALGAGRGRLVRQMLAEAMLLASLGGAAAMYLAVHGNRLVGALIAGTPGPRPNVDIRMFAFTAAVAMGAGVLISLAPLLQSTTPDLNDFLRGGATGGVRRSRLRAGLVAIQAALCTMLLIGAALFASSLGRVKGLDLGVDLDHTLSANFNIVTGVRPRDEINADYETMVARVRAIPGVQQIALEASGGAIMPYTQVTRERSWWNMSKQAGYLIGVDHGYFHTLGTTSLRGRDFDARDMMGAPQVAIISGPLAKLMWHNEDPLGKCLMVPERNSVRRDECIAVVGVLGGYWLGDILDRDRMLVYVPRLQRPRAFGRPTVMYVSASGDAASVATVATTVRKTIQSVRSDLPAVTITLMRDQADPQMRPWRLAATMFSLFGAVALIIAVVGLYGVVSFGAAQRSKEVAIRIVLGARSAQVVMAVAREGITAVLAGLVVGASAALGASAWVGHLLYQTSPRDLEIILGASALLLGAAVVASLVAAVQVLRRSPASVLRAD